MSTAPPAYNPYVNNNNNNKIGKYDENVEEDIPMAQSVETHHEKFIIVKVPEGVMDGYIIANLELEQKRLPFIIRRPIAGGGCEYWNLKDLENLNF